MDTQKLIELENRLRNLEQSSVVDRSISELDKRVINDAVKDGLDDVLWKKISYISSFASISMTTVSSEAFDDDVDSNAVGRESDTTAGKFYRPERVSRFRVNFYLGSSITKATAYIIAPGISTSFSAPTAMITTAISGVGIKIVAGVVSLISIRSGIVTILPTNTTITDDTTHILEIDYWVSHATVFFNGIQIGDIPCNLLGITFNTFFPYITSIGSSDGTSVNLTTENYEFIQSKI